ncbi:MAG: hypothetical protein ACREO9_11770, partial [Lysobacterales bacterium]
VQVGLPGYLTIAKSLKIRARHVSQCIFILALVLPVVVSSARRRFPTLALRVPAHSLAWRLAPRIHGLVAATQGRLIRG